MPKILLENVTKRWGDFTAVDNVTLEIPDRSFITLLGPSGCGKTTILNIVGGLDKPTKGDILFEGNKVKDFDNIRSKRIGYVFQNYNLFKIMSAFLLTDFGIFENIH